jgi:O-antigen ligase
MICAAGLGICVILTICRTGFVTYALVTGAVVGLISGLTITPKKAAIGLLILIGAAGIAYKASDTLMSRFSNTSFEDEYLEDEAEGRGMYLRLAALIVKDHVLGIGLNNWSYVVTEEYYPRINHESAPYGGTDCSLEALPKNEYAHMISPPAHNLPALTIGELGVPGFILFYLIWGRWFQMGVRSIWERSPRIVSRYGLGAFFGLLASFLHCLTEYGFRHVHIFFLVHILAGALAAAYVMPDDDGAVSRLIRQRLLALRRARAMEAEQ